MNKRTMATIACALATSAIALAAFAPLTYAAHRSAVGAGRMGMYALLALAVIAPAATARFATRGVSRVAIALLVAAPLACSALVARLASARVEAIMVGMIGDIVVRIVSELSADVMGPRVLAALASAACAWTAAIAIAGRVDGTPLRPRSRFVTALGATWVLASVTLFAISARGSGTIGLSLLVPASAIAMTWAARELDGHTSDDAIFVGALAIAGACLLERAIIGRAEMAAFDTQAMDAVTFEQRVTILSRLLEPEKIHRVAIGVHVVFAGALFGVIALRAPRERGGLIASVIVLGATAAVALDARAAFRHHLEIARRAFAFDAPLTLPTTGPRRGVSGNDRRVVIARDGAVLERRPPSNEEEPGEPLMGGTLTDIFADANLPCGAFADALAERERTRSSRYALLAESRQPTLPLDHLGELAVLTGGGRSLEGFRISIASFGSSVEAIVTRDMMTVRSPHDVATIRLVDVRDDERAHLASLARAENLATRAYIRVTIDRDDTVQTLVTALDTLDAPFHVSGFHGRHYALTFH